MKTLLISCRVFLAFTVLTGIAYPLAVTGIAKIFFPSQAEGSLVRGANGEVRGSLLIAQEFKGLGYFHARPSAVGFNPMPSGGSNLGPTSKALLDAVKQRQAAGASGGMLFTSGSGLDPHVSPADAEAQVAGVAAARNRPPERIRTLLDRATETRAFGILGEPTVNVLKLNLILDEEIARAP